MAKKRGLTEMNRLRSLVAALEQLIEVQDQAVLEQSARLERALEEISQRAGDLARSEGALRDQTRILQSILDSMSDGVAVTDEHGRFLHYNPAAEHIVGMGAIDAPPDAWPESYHLYLPDATTPLPPAQLPLVRAMHGESVNEAQILVRRPSSQSGTWLSVNARPLLDETGRARGGVAVFRDVTENLRAREALARNAKLLAQSNAELEQFAYVASHDLQEPLRMIKSYTDLLARRSAGRLDAEANGFMARIVDGVERLSVLISDLLTLSRVGGGDRAPEPTDSSAVCDRAIENLKAMIAKENAVVTREALPTVMGDPTEIGQVFQNLIANAVKFHGERPPRAHVSASRQGPHVEFAVRDNGIGIDPAFSDQIFTMFKRLHGRDDYPGTGIGLAICKKIVEKHGGRIRVESRPGEGSTFYFSLPLGTETDDRAA